MAIASNSKTGKGIQILILKKVSSGILIDMSLYCFSNACVGERVIWQKGEELIRKRKFEVRRT